MPHCRRRIGQPENLVLKKGKQARKKSHHKLYRTCNEVCSFSIFSSMWFFSIIEYNWIFHVKICYLFESWTVFQRAKSFQESEKLWESLESFPRILFTTKKHLNHPHVFNLYWRIRYKKKTCWVKNNFSFEMKMKKILGEKTYQKIWNVMDSSWHKKSWKGGQRRKANNKNINQTSEALEKITFNE